MTSIKTKPARAYHHGDLREALVKAARHAVDRAGPESVALKDLAIRIGVTQSAPYRHFPSREAVLEAVATDGFDRFRAALQDAEGEGAFADAFSRTAMAYVRFGRENPGVYRLMFSSKEICGADPGSPLAAASSAAFQDLLRRVGGRAPPARVQAVAMWIWSTLHGIVMLDAEGLLCGPRGVRTDVEEILQELVEAVQARVLGKPARPMAVRPEAKAGLSRPRTTVARTRKSAS